MIETFTAQEEAAIVVDSDGLGEKALRIIERLRAALFKEIRFSCKLEEEVHAARTFEDEIDRLQVELRDTQSVLAHNQRQHDTTIAQLVAANKLLETADTQSSEWVHRRAKHLGWEFIHPNQKRTYDQLTAELERKGTK